MNGGKGGEDSAMSSSAAAATSLQEMAQKVEATLLPSIQKHVQSDDFSSRKDGLDFLDVKNSLLLSYLIELVTYVRDTNRGTPNTASAQRLTEMKVVLDKMRGLDKKLRYQIDKLLAANNTASAYALGSGNKNPEDPLQFRPDRNALDNNDDNDDDSNSDVSDGDKDDGKADDDLVAARAALSMAKEKKQRYQDAKGNTNDNDDGVYRAPRLTAVPYAFDQENKQKEKEKRARHKLRATELAQTLRAQYGEAPDEEDVHGGSDYGKQRAAARRLAEKEAEKTKYEEDTMVRLQTSRVDKKEKKRLMREEASNLTAISDLSNLVRETRAFAREEGSDDDDHVPEPRNGGGGSGIARYENGKRRRESANVDGRLSSGRQGKTGKTGKAKNSLQAALYNTGGGDKSKKKKGRR